MKPCSRQIRIEWDWTVARWPRRVRHGPMWQHIQSLQLNAGVRCVTCDAKSSCRILPAQSHQKGQRAVP
eukprot:18485-Eustigmatos_ZCMA.PRE.1